MKKEEPTFHKNGNTFQQKHQPFSQKKPPLHFKRKHHNMSSGDDGEGEGEEERRDKPHFKSKDNIQLKNSIKNNPEGLVAVEMPTRLVQEEKKSFDPDQITISSDVWDSPENASGVSIRELILIEKLYNEAQSKSTLVKYQCIASSSSKKACCSICHETLEIQWDNEKEHWVHANVAHIHESDPYIRTKLMAISLSFSRDKLKALLQNQRPQSNEFAHIACIATNCRA